MMYIFLLFLLFISSMIKLAASFNIIIISETQYDDAQKNCTSAFFGTNLPFQILKNNALSVLEVLEVNDTAWIGVEKYIFGCEDRTETEQNGWICRELKHERVPTSYKMNYTCVANDTVIFTSNEATTYKNSLRKCREFSSSLAKLDGYNPLHRIPKSVQAPDRGTVWYESVGIDYLKSSIIRRCQFVRKIDECSYMVESGFCDDIRKGVCYTDEDMSYQSSLQFVEFDERDRVDIYAEDLCYVSTVTPIKKTTESKTSTPGATLSIQYIVIVILLITILALLAVIGIGFRYINQRYRERLRTILNIQTAESNSDETAHYIEISDRDNVLTSLQERSNHDISTDVIINDGNRNTIGLIEEQRSELWNNEHTSTSLENDRHSSEHSDDGYERPYTTLVADNRAEDEHVYRTTEQNSNNADTNSFHHVFYENAMEFTNPDSSSELG